VKCSKTTIQQRKGKHTHTQRKEKHCLCREKIAATCKMAGTSSSAPEERYKRSSPKESAVLVSGEKATNKERTERRRNKRQPHQDILSNKAR
jgi:hypothetical protein